MIQGFLYGPGIRRTLIGSAVAVLGTAAVTAAGRALETEASALRPGFALTILFASLLGGLWPGLLASLASFASYVGFFISPGDMLRFGAPEVFVLVAFLAVAVVVAWLQAAGGAAKAAQERLAFLADANRTLTTSLDLEETFGELTRLVVPRMGDWCAVQMRTGGEGTRTHVAHSDPERVALIEDLIRRYPPDPTDPNSLAARVMTTGQPIVLRKVPEDVLEQAAQDQEHLRLLRELGIRSAMVAPLIGRGRPLGTLTIANAESGRRFGPADLSFAMELARTAALAIENARLHEERTRVAQTLQNSLLPADIPEIPGVELAVRYRAAGQRDLVGGDFYDVFESGENMWGVALGDVCGKGPEAAALTGLVRHTIRTAAVGGRKPSSVLDVVNRQIIRNKTDRFCTATVGRIRPSNGRVAVDVSCGGHPPPLVYRPGRTVEAADCLGTLLGVFPDPELVDSPVELQPGDAIVFYTDGVTERFERGGNAGDSTLVALLWDSDGLDADQIADRIYLNAAEPASEGPRDDMALVVLRVLPPRG
jgi:serine phosphatase RsbU (regulator of sigma subunit)